MLHVLLPDQYLGEAGERIAEPQKRLMLAVLQTVVDDCTGSAYRRSTGQLGPVDSKAQLEASEYVASDDRSWPFSFRNICDALGLDVGYLRRGISTAASADDARTTTRSAEVAEVVPQVPRGCAPLSRRETGGVDCDHDDARQRTGAGAQRPHQ